MARLTVAALLTASLVLATACGDDGGEQPTVTGTAVEQTPHATAEETTPPGETPPAAQAPNVAPAPNIVLPEGFAAYPIATGFVRATSVAPAPDGSLFVSQRHGEVYRLTDPDGDGVFDGRTEFLTRDGDITGMLVDGEGLLYVSSTGTITTARDSDDDGVADEITDIITGLPTGRHQNNGIAIGPDGKLYITNGSTCDDCVEADERSAAILQATLDGSDLRVYARGLRNPYDITFDAQGQLWSTDNGSDTPCETDDELNLIIDGGDYGWPYGNEGCDETADGNPPLASLGLHTASTGLTYYDRGAFPAQYAGSIYATVWGSFFATPDPYNRLLLRVSTADDTGIVEEFGSGFEHPIDVFADTDGSLLVLDYGSDDPDAATGTLYRVIYIGS